jgi:hypothetical protein
MLYLFAGFFFTSNTQYENPGSATGCWSWATAGAIRLVVDCAVKLQLLPMLM